MHRRVLGRPSFAVAGRRAVRRVATFSRSEERHRDVVAIGFFETEEDMRKGDEVLNSMSPPTGDTGMGTRSSVDLCEVKLQVEAP